jgi:hypothetical protein
VVLAGVALALALLAGHPQTFLLLGYTSLAYLIYRLLGMGAGWQRGLLAVFLFGVVAAGLSAAQWLPTLQFQTQTYRDDLSFDDKGGGFVFQDVAQFVFPGMLGEWSSLYLSIPALLLVMVALWRQTRGAWFWASVLLFGLLLSFGQKLVIYDVVYILLPGFSFFRGQERSVFLVALAGSILTALGTFVLLNTAFSGREGRYLRRAAIGLISFCAIFAIIFFVLRLMPPDGELYQTALGSAIFSLFLSILTFFLLFAILRQPASNWLAVGLAALIIFDLFSVNMGNSNFEAIPADERLAEPAYIDTIKGNLDPGQHVEGLRGIRDSYGALYRVPDIWGNSPLRFDAVEFYLWQIPIERRWELLAVQVVNSEWTELPVPYTLVGTGEDEEGPFNIFRLENPRPFAHPVFTADVIGDEERARERLADLDYDLRNRVILEENPGLLSELPGGSDYQVTVDTLEPEHIKLRTEIAAPAVLTLALPYDSGWQVTVDGAEAELLNAYTGLSAVYLEEGSHTVELRYEPWTFQVGLWVSIVTLLLVIGSFMLHLVRGRRRQESSEG